MQSTPPDSFPPPEQPQPMRKQAQLAREQNSWFHSPIVGYVASFFLVGLLLLIEKIDEHIPQVSLFIGTPFCILSILVALIWGTGPALVALVLGLLVVASFIAPDFLNLNVLRDITIVAPFLLLQLVAIVTVIRLERSRRELQHRNQLLDCARQELQHSNQRLEQANALKNYVLTRAAHELKTPLTTILGRIQLLSSRAEKSSETSESMADFRESLSVVEARARHLRALIESLFELSQAYANGSSSPSPACDLIGLCQKVIEQQRMLSGRIIDLHGPAHSLLLAIDEQRLSQVLGHVLTNAVKYSPKSTPIQVDVQFDEQFATLSVSNECPVLSSDQLAHLFDPLYRTTDVVYSSLPGWGLGLTISKALLERAGGQIWAEASGTNRMTFSIKLPLQKTAERGGSPS